VSPACP